MRKKDNKKQFAVYHGDEFVMVGNRYEVAEHEGISVDDVSHYASPVIHKRFESKKSHNKGGLYITRIEEDEEDEST